MVNGSIITDSGKKIILNRSYKASPDYTVPTKFKLGISNGTPNVGDTDLDDTIPITNGTVNDDGDNTLTGSSGGNNTTDNTTTYKIGGGVSDDTSQNLIANVSNATKIWTISNLASAGSNVTSSYFGGVWIYIKDATALAKFKTSGTALTLKLGSDSSNYYSITRTAALLATGWNWVADHDTAVSGWTETGTVAGNVDTYIIEIVTNNATDTFVAGDVLADLLRTWQVSDTVKTFETGYPAIDETNHEVEIRCAVSSTLANGFDLDGFCLVNTDGTVLMHSEDTITAESKSNTDQFTFIVKDRLI